MLWNSTNFDTKRDDPNELNTKRVDSKGDGPSLDPRPFKNPRYSLLYTSCFHHGESSQFHPSSFLRRQQSGSSACAGGRDVLLRTRYPPRDADDDCGASNNGGDPGAATGTSVIAAQSDVVAPAAERGAVTIEGEANVAPHKTGDGHPNPCQGL